VARVIVSNETLRRQITNMRPGIICGLRVVTRTKATAASIVTSMAEDKFVNDTSNPRILV
jgi:hypothetical protein